MRMIAAKTYKALHEAKVTEDAARDAAEEMGEIFVSLRELREEIRVRFSVVTALVVGLVLLAAGTLVRVLLLPVN